MGESSDITGSYGEMEKRPETAQALEAELREHVERLTDVVPVIGSVALFQTVEHERLIATADALVDVAQETRRRIGEMSITEPFGAEASYWTVFRMFTVEKNLGSARTTAEIFEYLASNYDMTHETTETLETTLLEWADDIVTDAKARGINGTFTRIGDSFVFAEQATRRNPLVEASQPLPKIVTEPSTEPVVRAEPTAETLEPLDELAATISRFLGEQTDGIAKQSDIKKQIVRLGGAHSAEHLQRDIDMLVERGSFYKFRVDKVAYLSLEPQNDVSVVRENDNDEGETKVGSFDVSLAMTILEKMTAHGSHFNQKMTMNELWRRINEDAAVSQRVPEEEAEQLKRVCRQLQTIGLLSAGIKPTAEVKSKRTRGSSRSQFRVRLESQDQKKQIQELLQLPNVAELLGQMYITRVNRP